MNEVYSNSNATSSMQHMKIACQQEEAVRDVDVRDTAPVTNKVGDTVVDANVAPMTVEAEVAPKKVEADVAPTVVEAEVAPNLVEAEIPPNKVVVNETPSAGPDPTPADLLDISEEIEGIPDSKESGGVILVDSEPDKNLNEPVEGKPDISTTRGVLEVNSSSNQQENSTKKTVTFSEEPIPIDHGLSHPKRTRKKNQKLKPTYDPSKLWRSTRNSRQNA